MKAIVDGEPPDLPASAFSEAARDFTAGCLNKIPNLRPTYPMLLQHAWLAPLIKPDTIAEEDEEAEEPAEPGAAGPEGDVVDAEVADWVVQMLEKRRQGVLGRSAKPALHKVALDAVGTPGDAGTPPVVAV